LRYSSSFLIRTHAARTICSEEEEEGEEEEDEEDEEDEDEEDIVEKRLFAYEKEDAVVVVLYVMTQRASPRRRMSPSRMERVLVESIVLFLKVTEQQPANRNL
jgi:hypothetical protein